MPNHPSCYLRSFYINSPIGSMVIKSCTRGLHAISQSDTIDDSNFAEVKGLVSTLQMPKLCPVLTTDKFQSRVWVMLAQQVGPGKTISYKELAEVANNPGAARAVGSAMSANPFQIVVPCHRVLPSSGKLGKYAFGKKNKVKAWLLHHEGVSVLN
ncbi:methylated-DNA--protein-cysteine methyltransferase isoform X2 [Hetaerina americana]|uniref:methylated-DNA--protein-cysteine methyltransferase isoform X2 n=1 Tax=Hetaerina americana TaxID=62018 RepID=UPI003A7F45F0